MWYWWSMFLCNIAYSLVMIIGGWCMWKHTPKKINSSVGYRSKWSKKTQATWDFANKNCGERWWKIGWIMLFPTILIQIPFYGENYNAIGIVTLVICVVEVTILLVSIPFTEKALKENFNENGTRKE